MLLDREAEGRGDGMAQSQPSPSTIEPKRELKVAIVGFWEGTRDMAPFGDPAWEIWGCNHGFPYLKGGPDSWTRWFDIHDPQWSAESHPPAVWADLERFLKTSHGKPIYMQRHFPAYPDSVAFPRAEVEARFPVTHNRSFRRYNTNALTYMISLALLEGATEIAVYGADMRGDEEYGAQRPAVEYWLGRAEGMGVRVTVPPQSGLLNPDGMDYGYDEDKSLLVEMRRTLLAEKARVVEERDKATNNFYALEGAQQIVQDLIRRVEQKMRGGGAL